jgi:hypothetical protein
MATQTTHRIKDECRVLDNRRKRLANASLVTRHMSATVQTSRDHTNDAPCPTQTLPYQPVHASGRCDRELPAYGVSRATHARADRSHTQSELLKPHLALARVL